VRGAGTDIWNTADQFQYLSQPLTGDGQLQARLLTLGNTDPWAKAAVMIRGSLAANAPHAMLTATSAFGVSFQYRPSVGAASQAPPGSSQPKPIWIRIRRVGNVFTGSYSVDGVAWTVLASQTVTMPASVLMGLAVTSHNPGAVTTATFSDVAVS
jgi:hypothetical protein